MKKLSILMWARVVCGLLFLSLNAGIANAQPLEDVSLAFQNDGVVATIQLTGPVQYLRHFPASHGKTLEIFYDRVQGSSEAWVNNEVRKSPPSGLIPSFTVTTRDQATQPKLVIEFSREAEYSVEPGKDKRSLLITIRPEKRPIATGPLPLLPVIKALTPTPTNATPDVLAMADYNQQAQALMTQGSNALQAKDNAAAVEAFNKLLLLPPNDYTQDGQEWIGVARERAQQPEKARIEYELYLRLYPEGEGAARVGQRLAGLSGRDADQGIVETTEKKQKDRWLSFGSISSRYYFGNSTDVNAIQQFNGAPETITTSFTDTSMLITSVDASERYISEDYDARLVFRDVDTRNFLSDRASTNRVSAAYGEFKIRNIDYLVRVGRQSAYGGGVGGRFDGLHASYGQPQDLRVNASVGLLTDYSQGSTPKFLSVGVDKDQFSFYGINQSVDGELDRRAVGTEWRYFEDKRTVFASLEYDMNFKALNSAQVMGGMPAPERLDKLPAGTMINFMFDHRKSPSLSIRNSLNGAATGSILTLKQTLTENEVRDLALLRTATSNMAQLGLTFPFKQKWQAGADVRISNITGLPASGTLPVGGVIPAEGYIAAMPSRGTDMSVTSTVTGSGIVKEGDIWSGSASLNYSSAANGQSLFIYNHLMLKQGWGLDSSLQLYRQTDQFGGKVSRISPMVRAAYQLRERLSFDVDGGVEQTNYTGASQTSKITRVFFSGGLRWDF